jgi:nucleotide-binding universal stress UspA family protein
VGWDGSPQAVRAVTTSLPCLAKARSVVVVTVGDDLDSDPAALKAYLSRHDITAKLRCVAPVAGIRAGSLLLSAAREEGADLLVMGGYGHGPWREFLFGGATRDLVGTSLLPLLLQH